MHQLPRKPVPPVTRTVSLESGMQRTVSLSPWCRRCRCATMWVVQGTGLIKRAALASGLIATVAAVALVAAPGGSAAPAIVPPSPKAEFDYQIGGDYQPPAGVTAVTRDWFSGKPAPDPTYSVCYVNAFQTPGQRARDRPARRAGQLAQEADPDQARR